MFYDNFCSEFFSENFSEFQINMRIIVGENSGDAIFNALFYFLKIKRFVKKSSDLIVPGVFGKSGDKYCPTDFFSLVDIFLIS